MKTQNRHKNSGFTLIEIGVVLAIIGVLAAISIPSVSYFLRQGRVKSVVGSVNSVKNWLSSLQASGATGGTLPVTEGGQPPVLGTALSGQTPLLVANAARLDQVLVSAGISDKLLTFSMGNQTTVPEGEGADLVWNVRKHRFYLSDGSGGASTTATAARDWSNCSRIEARVVDPVGIPSSVFGANFRLNGSTSLPGNTVVAYAVLKEVPYKDAIELAKVLDGEDLVTASEGAVSDQDAGPVVFKHPDAGLSTTDVYIYLANI